MVSLKNSDDFEDDVFNVVTKEGIIMAIHIKERGTRKGKGKISIQRPTASSGESFFIVLICFPTLKSETGSSSITHSSFDGEAVENMKTFDTFNASLSHALPFLKRDVSKKLMLLS
jgi:hypothetical protein